MSLGALQLAERGRPEAVRAIVRHELAHLRNRDVDLGGLTRSAGRILLAVLGGALLLSAVPETGRTADVMVPFVGRVVVLGLLVWLIRAAVLRSREHEADVRASIPALRAGEPAFDVAFFPDPPTVAGSARLHRWWWAVAGSHPPAALRRAAVAAPERLLRAGFGEALATGVTAGLLLDNVRSALLSAASGFPTVGALLPGLVVGGFATAVADCNCGGRRWPRWPPAACCPPASRPVWGWPPVSSSASCSVREASTSPCAWRSPRHPGPRSAWSRCSCSAASCSSRWTVTAAASWLPVARARSLHPVLWGGSVVGTLASGAALNSFSGLAVRVWGGLPVDRFHVGILVDAFSAKTAVPLLVAALFPLAAAVRAARPATARAVDADSGRTVFLPRPRCRLIAVLGPVVPVGLGATAAAVFGGGLVPAGLMLSFAVLSWFGSPTPEDVTYGFISLAGVVALLAAVAAGSLASGRELGHSAGPRDGGSHADYKHAGAGRCELDGRHVRDRRLPWPRIRSCRLQRSRRCCSQAP